MFFWYLLNYLEKDGGFASVRITLANPLPLFFEKLLFLFHLTYRTRRDAEKRGLIFTVLAQNLFWSI